MTYPNKTKIRESVKTLILSGEIQIPTNQLHDSKKFVDDIISTEFRVQKTLWNIHQQQEGNKFRDELEKEFEYDLKLYSQSVKQAIWERSCDDGHSFGQGEIRSNYIDNLEFTLKLLQ